MDFVQHQKFAESLKGCAAKVAVSGYDHPLMDELFEPSQWLKIPGEDRTIHSTKGKRQEVLWTNFEPRGQEGLFG
jgi:DNA adenine methylase